MKPIDAGCPKRRVTLAAGLFLTLQTTAWSAGASGKLIHILTGGGQWLISYDSETFERGPLQDCAIKLSGIDPLLGLTYARGRLYSVDMNWEILPDRFVEIHPANGDPVVPGFTGQSQTTNWALDFNPVDGRLYGIESHLRLFEIDPTTGVATFLTNLSGPSFAQFGARSLSIDSTGKSVVAQDGIGTGGPTFGYLDLQTGAVTPVGRLGIGIGIILDTAFDAQGVLWAIWDDYVVQSNDGLYQVYVEELSFK